MEKFMAISVRQLQFLDSMQFTAGKPLDKLTQKLNGDKEFRYTKQAFSDDERFELVKEKGFFPHDFFDNTFNSL